jgi:hypothetical protein
VSKKIDLQVRTVHGRCEEQGWLRQLKEGRGVLKVDRTLGLPEKPPFKTRAIAVRKICKRNITENMESFAVQRQENWLAKGRPKYGKVPSPIRDETSGRDVRSKASATGIVLSPEYS